MRIFEELEDFDKDDLNISGEDIDIEADDDWLTSILNDDMMDYEKEELIGSQIVHDFNNKEPEFPAFEQPIDEPTNDNKMQVVSLDDVLSIIQQVMGNTSAPVNQSASAVSTGTSEVPVMTGDDGPGKTATPLQGGEEALKKVFFQGEGNETLDSDFDALYDSINNLESHVTNDSSYVDVVGGRAMKSDIEQPGLKAIDRDFDNSSNNTGSSIASGQETVIEPQAEIVGDETPEVDIDFNPSGCQSMKIPVAERKPGIYNDIEDGELGPDRLVQGLPKSSDWDDDDEYDHDEDTELLLDIDEEEDTDGSIEDGEELVEAEVDELTGEMKHPDLDRFSAVDDYSQDDDEFEIGIPEDEFEPAYEEPQGNAITVDKSMNIGGQKVKLILTGVMITESELKYIGETVKNAGNSLKKIEGQGNKLNIIVEAEEKQYTINYIDQPRNKTKTPFSIKSHQFTSLEEALDRINYKRGQKESEVFNKIIDESILLREFANTRDADIFNDFKEVKIASNWAVRNVGALNLKNGLNEVFSKITQTGTEPNTLVKDQNNNFYLIKGNLKERSKVGTKKELVEYKQNKSLGVVEVVGLFENDEKGLGKVMYKIQRTSIPLLVWK